MYCGMRGKCKSGRMTGYRHLDFEEGGELWVCAGCDLPTRMVFEKLTNGYAPARATSISSEVHDADGRVFLRWHTTVSGEHITTMNFFPYPRRDLLPDMPGRQPLLDIWQKIDGEVDAIMSAATVDKEYHKYRAAAFAETILIVMSPFYRDTAEVSAEALARWQARQAGEAHETPGLAETLWVPAQKAYTEARSGGGRTITPAKLPDNKVAFIKHSLETGSMSPDALAKMFEVSVEVITAAVTP